MAPLTSTPTPTTVANLAPTLKPEGQSFAGDEFSNNLFSDLAPLLTLFGEQVRIGFLQAYGRAKQYRLQSNSYPCPWAGQTTYFSPWVH